MSTKLTLSLPKDAAERLLKLWNEGKLTELGGIGVMSVDAHEYKRCAWCGANLTGGRLTYCSEDCSLSDEGKL